jgi:hypothetical protein
MRTTVFGLGGALLLTMNSLAIARQLPVVMTVAQDVVAPGAPVTVTVEGPPLQSFAVLGSSVGAGLSYAGQNLALGADFAVLASGTLDGTGRGVVSVTPPFLFTALDRYYLQAAASRGLAHRPARCHRCNGCNGCNGRNGASGSARPTGSSWSRRHAGSVRHGHESRLRSPWHRLHAWPDHPVCGCERRGPTRRWPAAPDQLQHRALLAHRHDLRRRRPYDLCAARPASRRTQRTHLHDLRRGGLPVVEMRGRRTL